MSTEHDRAPGARNTEGTQAVNATDTIDDLEATQREWLRDLAEKAGAP